MQQGIKAGDTLWLRFKYYSFLDLDPKVSTGTQSGQQDSGTFPSCQAGSIYVSMCLSSQFAPPTQHWPG